MKVYGVCRTGTHGGVSCMQDGHPWRCIAYAGRAPMEVYSEHIEKK